MVQAPTRAARSAVIKFCYQAGHHNIFGHASLCTRLTGVTRAFMSQITRHNGITFTCSSQHYQDYSDWPIITLCEDPMAADTMRCSLDRYRELVDRGELPEDAREVLPNGMAVNMYMTGTARQWAHVMRERLCNRNTKEMRIWAGYMFIHLQEWFPELFDHVGPQCIEGKCRQGRMACKEKKYARLIG